MTQSRDTTVKLSKQAYFIVNDSINSEMKKITYCFKDEKHAKDSLMLEIWDPDKILEYPMKYDIAKKEWRVEVERSKNASELFLIKSAKEVGHKDNYKAPVLQQGFLTLVNGVPQPTNISNVPKGKLEKYLLSKDGKIQKTSHPDEKKLKPGERYITIYTPPGYDPERKQPYRLQITLDGSQYLFPMHMNVILDNLASTNEIDPPVTVFMSPASGPPNKKKKGFGIVMPPGYGLSMRLKEYSPNPEFSELLASLPKTLQDQFNISHDSKDMTLWGVSKGGLCVVYTGLLHPEVFGNVIAQSPEAWNIPTQNGKNWRDGIVDVSVGNENLTWSTATALLPKKEGEHKEYITEMVRSGYDEISGRALDSSKPIRFYFDAGEKEKFYDAKAGTANLVKATELLITALQEKNHHVMDGKLHLLPGGHHNMTWMPNISIIQRQLYGISPALKKEKKHMSSATIAKTAGFQLPPASTPSPSTLNNKKVDKSVDVTDEQMAKSDFGQNSHVTKISRGGR